MSIPIRLLKIIPIVATLLALHVGVVHAEKPTKEAVGTFEMACRSILTKVVTNHEISTDENTYIAYCSDSSSKSDKKVYAGALLVVPFPSKVGKCSGNKPFPYLGRCYPAAFGKRVIQTTCQTKIKIRRIWLFPGARWYYTAGKWTGPYDTEDGKTHCDDGVVGTKE